MQTLGGHDTRIVGADRPAAAPRLNRHEKRHKDAAEWMPAQNQCWFARTVVAVKLKYGLTVDRREYEALAAVLSRCP